MAKEKNILSREMKEKAQPFYRGLGLTPLSDSKSIEGRILSMERKNRKQKHISRSIALFEAGALLALALTQGKVVKNDFDNGGTEE